MASQQNTASITPITESLHVDTLLDTAPIKPLQYLVFIACGLVALLDGMDSQSIGVAGPMMAGDLQMKMAQFTPALSSGLLGASLGALFFGGIADRFGRRPVLIAATLLFGIFTLLTAIPTSFTGLVVLRFIAGLGLGGATPCFITLSAEFAPTRHRTAIASLLWAAYPLGNAVGGFTSAFVITHSTWHMVFLVAGIPTMLLGLLMLMLLPESVRYMVARQHDRPSEADQLYIQRLARRVDRSLGAGPVNLVGPAMIAAKKRGFIESLSLLFAEKRAVGTIMLWIVLYTGFATTTVMVLMSPTIFRADGLSLGTSGQLVGIFSICAMIGMAIAGKLAQKFGPRLALAPAYLIGACFLALLGNFHDPIILGCIMAIIGLSAPLATGGGVALAAIFYPTEIRSSGVGWGMGLGRFGQVCSPLLIGLMLSFSWTPGHILLVMAGAPLIGGLALLFLSGSLRHGAEQAKIG